MGKGNKSKKQDSAEDSGGATKTEQKRQAVLLADSFVNTFRPLSLDRPKVLCPLNNVSLLDYAMDFLAGVGIEELVVVCVSDAVEEHVQQHAWSTSRTIDVIVVKDSSLTNTGDALREVDKRNLIQCDPFVLMFGDVVTNVDIVGALAAHKARRKKDSSAIMTLLLKHVGGGTLVGKDGGGTDSPTISSCRLRSTADDLIVGLDPTQENRVVVFDDQPSSGSVSIPCPFLKVHSHVELHCDLMDTGIYICSPDVLARFSDEFDYLDLRRQFITNSVAEEEEGLQNRIHAHILRPAEYGARVQDFRTYHAISQDMLQRWCYPVVPDNLPSGYEKQYRYVLQQRNYLYRETKCSSGGPTKVGRSSVCSGPGMIGSSCRIGEDCTIQSSVIGNQCKIGSGVTLKESHLWDGVTIEVGATVLQSILSHGCLIKAGAVVRRGCVIGKGCVVGENVVIPEYTRITLAEDDSDDEFDDDDAFGDDSDDDDDSSNNQRQEKQHAQASENISDHTVVGPDGMGRAWEPSTDDNSDDEDDDESDDGKSNAINKIKTQSIGFGLHSIYERRTANQKEGEDGFSDGDDDNDQDGMQDFSGYADDGAFSFGQAPPSSNVGGGSGAGAAPTLVYGRTAADVVKDLKEICMDFEETSPIENLSIELNSYKFSQNATYSDCTMGATLAILDRMQITKAMSDGKLVGALKARLEYWAPLLQKMSIGQEEEKSIVLALERVATTEGEVGEKLSGGMSFRFLLQTLHDEEIVSEEAILSWAEDRKSEPEDSQLGKLFRLQSIQDFLEWLEEESEDEDDDEEDDSEDD